MGKFHNEDIKVINLRIKQDSGHLNNIETKQDGKKNRSKRNKDFDTPLII